MTPFPSELCDRLVELTRRGNVMEWHQRMRRIADLAKINTAQVEISSSPHGYAHNIVKYASVRELLKELDFYVSILERARKEFRDAKGRGRDWTP